MAAAYSSVSRAALSNDGASRRRSACSANPPSPQPSRATEMATNAKWYQMVAEKIRVSPISNMRPESVMRKTAA